MSLHPQCKAFLDQIAAAGGRPLHELSPAEARANAMPPDLAGPEQPVHRVVDRRIPGDGGLIPVRTYYPREASQLPGLVFFHGGGFVLGGLDSSDRTCRALANGSGCAVVSVDYRLAPEHPFPAPCDDAVQAVQWFAAQRAALDFDTGFLAVAGDSAGGHLAALAAQQVNADAGRQVVAAQLLIYPVTAPVLSTESYRAFADGPGLTRDEMAWFWTQFIGADALAHGAQHEDPRIHLMAQAPQVQPPATAIVVAANDVLRDDGLAYADFLVRHDATVVTIEASGMTHGFARLQPDAPRAREWMQRAAQAFTSLFDEA